MSEKFGLHDWARGRLLPMLLAVVAFVLIFLHSWPMLLVAAVLASVGVWLTVRANRRGRPRQRQ